MVEPHGSNDPIGMKALQCKATAKSSGKRCKKYAILGGTVCMKHGGAAPQVRRKAQQRIEAAGITPERTMLEIARIAYQDARWFRDEDGILIPVAELSDDAAAVLAGTEDVIKNVEAGDGHVDTIHKIKKWDKVKCLEMLAKDQGRLVERVEHSGDVSFTWQTSE